jgi:hypothetical protein
MCHDVDPLLARTTFRRVGVGVIMLPQQGHGKSRALFCAFSASAEQVMRLMLPDSNNGQADFRRGSLR